MANFNGRKDLVHFPMLNHNWILLLHTLTIKINIIRRKHSRMNTRNCYKNLMLNMMTNICLIGLNWIISHWCCRYIAVIPPYSINPINYLALKMKKLYVITLLLLLSICGYSQSRYISVHTKKIVYTRDGGICQCCGSSLDLEYDHIVPFSCGGNSNASNVQLLCMNCNRSKSNSCVCKIHNKRVGSNCCDRKTTNKTSTTSQQCSGVTKKGARCKKRTTNSNGRCHLH